MKKFKIGERVICVTNVIGCLLKDKEGTMIAYSGNYYGVEFDDKCKGLNNCSGKGKKGYCLWILGSDLKNGTITDWRKHFRGKHK